MRIRRVLAANPGPFTGPGTNTWLLDAAGRAVVIDPGPVDGTLPSVGSPAPSALTAGGGTVASAHAAAIVELLDGLTPHGVLVTHAHPDHAPLAKPLAARLGVPTYGYAPGPDFSPDILLADGDRLAVGDVAIEALYTPGHSDDHLCFLVGRVLFTGDHIMGGSSVVIDDLVPYLESLRRLRALDLDRLYPGHGPELDRPTDIIDGYLAHRLEREAQMLEAVGRGAGTVGEVVEAVYREVDPSLYPLAALSVAAHLRKLAGEGRVRFEGAGWDDPVEVRR